MSRHLALLAAGLVALLAGSCGSGGGGSTAGTYELDMEALLAHLENVAASQMSEMPPDQQALVKPMMTQMLEQYRASSMRMTLADDGTFDGESSFLGREGTVRGTWSLEGERLSLRQTHKDGQAAEETHEAILSGDEIRFIEQQGDQQMQLVLRRR